MSALRRGVRNAVATLRWRLVRPSLQTRTLGRAAIGPAHPSHTSVVTDQEVLQRAFLCFAPPLAR
jgi:hypothetical protein